VNFFVDDLKIGDRNILVNAAYDVFQKVVFSRLCEDSKYIGYYSTSDSRQIICTENIQVHTAGKQLVQLIDNYGTNELSDFIPKIQESINISQRVVDQFYFQQNFINECYNTPQLRAGSTAYYFTGTQKCRSDGAASLECPSGICGFSTNCQAALATSAASFSQLAKMQTDVDRQLRLADWTIINCLIVDTDANDSGCGPNATKKCTSKEFNVSQMFNGARFSDNGSGIAWQMSGQCLMQLYDVYINVLKNDNSLVAKGLNQLYTGLTKIFELQKDEGIPASFCKDGSWRFQEGPINKILLDDPSTLDKKSSNQQNNDEDLKEKTRNKTDATASSTTTGPQRSKLTNSGFENINFFRYSHLAATCWGTLSLSYVNNNGDDGFNFFSDKIPEFRPFPEGQIISPAFIEQFADDNRVSCFFKDLDSFPESCAVEGLDEDLARTIQLACNSLSTASAENLVSPPSSYAKLNVTDKFNWSNICRANPFFTSCTEEKQAFGVVQAVTLSREDGTCNL
jgi:hypothetical protein